MARMMASSRLFDLLASGEKAAGHRCRPAPSGGSSHRSCAPCSAADTRPGSHRLAPIAGGREPLHRLDVELHLLASKSDPERGEVALGLDQLAHRRRRLIEHQPDHRGPGLVGDLRGPFEQRSVAAVTLAVVLLTASLARSAVLSTPPWPHPSPAWHHPGWWPGPWSIPFRRLPIDVEDDLVGLDALQKPQGPVCFVMMPVHDRTAAILLSNQHFPWNCAARWRCAMRCCNAALWLAHPWGWRSCRAGRPCARSACKGRDRSADASDSQPVLQPRRRCFPAC